MINIIHKKESKQINVLDNRYYTLDEIDYFPSVTTILEVFPKGFGFNQWLKDVGNNASEIADRAATSGTKVHDACDALNKGNEINWILENGTGLYTLEEWKMILKFKDFVTSTKIKLIKSEFNMCSPTLGYGGTVDMIAEISGKKFLIDIKTSNYLHTSHELQVSAYATMYNDIEKEEAPIDCTAILWLKAATRTSKIDPAKNIFQGEGWQLKTFDRSYPDAYKIFSHTHNIWREENPVWKPLNKIYPDTIKL